MRVFIDVISAFASIVVALSLPLSQRNDDADDLLKGVWFSDAEVADIWASNAEAGDRGDASMHMRTRIANFQMHQWLATDGDEGAMRSKIGACEGCRLQA